MVVQVWLDTSWLVLLVQLQVCKFQMFGQNRQNVVLVTAKRPLTGLTCQLVGSQGAHGWSHGNRPGIKTMGCEKNANTEGE